MEVLTSGVVLDLMYVWLGGLIVMMAMPLIAGEAISRNIGFVEVLVSAVFWPLLVAYWLITRNK